MVNTRRISSPACEQGAGALPAPRARCAGRHPTSAGHDSGAQRARLATVTTGVDSHDFRDVLSRYVTGVAVVTTRTVVPTAPPGTSTAHGDVVDHAMTANSFASVSLEPPLVLVCITRDTRFREAMGDGSNPWAVSILGAQNLPAAKWFATRGRPLEDQFGTVAHHRGANGALLLDQALGFLECSTEAIHPAGDHDIFIGRVTAMGLGPESSTEPPLLYFNHGFTELTQG